MYVFKRYQKFVYLWSYSIWQVCGSYYYERSKRINRKRLCKTSCEVQSLEVTAVLRKERNALFDISKIPCRIETTKQTSTINKMSYISRINLWIVHSYKISKIYLSSLIQYLKVTFKLFWGNNLSFLFIYFVYFSINVKDFTRNNYEFNV